MFKFKKKQQAQILKETAPESEPSLPSVITEASTTVESQKQEKNTGPNAPYSSQQFNDKALEPSTSHPTGQSPAKQEELKPLQGNTTIRYAGFWPRTAALILDETLLFGFQIATFACFMVIGIATLYQPVLAILLVAFLIAWLAVQFWLYTAWFEQSNLRATPGKFLLGLQVADGQLRKMTFWKSTKRLILQGVITFLLTALIVISIRLINSPDLERAEKFAGLAALLIGTCWCLFNERKQTIFDLVAGRFVLHSDPTRARPTWNGETRHLQHFLERLKQCFSLSWSELYSAKLIAPVLLSTAACVIGILFSLGDITATVSRVTKIESEFGNAGNAKSAPPAQRLQALNISPGDAAKDYQKLYLISVGLRQSAWQEHITDRQLQINPHDQSAMRNRADLTLTADKDFPAAEKQYLEIDADEGTNWDIWGRGESFEKAAACAAEYDLHRSQYLLHRALAYDPFDVQALELQCSLDQKSNNASRLESDNRRLAEAQKYQFKKYQLHVSDSDAPSTLDSAETRLKVILKQTTDCTAAHIVLAQCFAAKKQMDKAEQQYTQATLIDPEDPIPFVYRAQFFQNDAVNLDRALADINKALSLRESAKLLKMRAEIYSASGNKGAAKADYVKICQARPTVDNLLVFAEFLLDHGDTSGAREKVRMARVALPLDTKFQANAHPQLSSEGIELSSVSSKQSDAKDYEGALESANFLISFQPDQEAYSLQASALEELGRGDEALAARSRAIETELERQRKNSALSAQIYRSLEKIPVIPLAALLVGSEDQAPSAPSPKFDNDCLATLYGERSACEFRLGNLRACIADYEKTASLSDEAGTTFSAPVVLAYLMLHEPNQAITFLRSRLEAEKLPVSQWLDLAELYKRNSNSAEAAYCKKKGFDEANKLINKDNTDPSNLFERGKLYLRTEKFNLALQDFSKAIAADKDGEKSYFVIRAQAYNALGRFDKALEDVREADSYSDSNLAKAVALFGKKSYHEALVEFDAAIAADSSDSSAFYGKGRLYEKLGDEINAKRNIALATKHGYFLDPSIIRFNYDKLH